MSPKGVLKNAESIGLCLVLWIVSGFISLTGKLTTKLYVLFIICIVQLFRGILLCRNWYIDTKKWC